MPAIAASRVATAAWAVAPEGAVGGRCAWRHPARAVCRAAADRRRVGNHLARKGGGRRVVVATRASERWMAGLRPPPPPAGDTDPKIGPPRGSTQLCRRPPLRGMRGRGGRYPESDRSRAAAIYRGQCSSKPGCDTERDRSSVGDRPFVEGGDAILRMTAIGRPPSTVGRAQLNREEAPKEVASLRVTASARMAPRAKLRVGSLRPAEAFIPGPVGVRPPV